MRIFLIIAIGISLLGCTEPFEFDARSAVDVIDAKVSTLEGRSYVRIYTIQEDGQVDEINNLDVKIVTNTGEEHDFTFNGDSGVYLPQFTTFRGQEGMKYRMEASEADVLIYRSEYDSIVPAIDFTVDTKDTTVLSFNSLNIIDERMGTAAIVTVEDQQGPVYSKMEFSYSYIDFFTEEAVNVDFEDEFSLYSCNDSQECNREIDIPVGVTLTNEWYFIKVDAACNAALDTLDGGFILNCTAPCCRYEEDWPTVFEVIVESMSEPTYDYWKNVIRLRNNDGLVFDTYPFPLASNIVCDQCDREVTGLFRAVSEVQRRWNVIL